MGTQDRDWYREELKKKQRHRFLPAIIQYAVWLYRRFNLSHRDVEDLLAERGVEVSYESVELSHQPTRTRERAFECCNEVGAA